jgi:molybdopterin-guanine dinucleotide biosynthesis protein A
LREPYRGAPLLHHAVLRLSDLCLEVVVVVGPQDPEPDLPTRPGLRLARDLVEGRGPLAGLASGLADVETELALVAAGDMPDMSSSVLLEMVGGAQRSGADAVALDDLGTLRPLPVVLRVDPARQASHALLGRGERSLRALLAALRVTRLSEGTWRPLDPHGGTLRDVDLPEDLSG